MLRKFTKVALTSLVLAAAIAWFYLPEAGVTVDTATAQQGTVQSTITVTGKVISEQEVKLTSSMLGQIQSIEAKEGDIVKQGQILARLDASDLNAMVNRARAILARDEEAVAEAARKLNRLRSVSASGGASRQVVDDAEAEWRSAVARKRVSESELRIMEIRLQKTRIIAPFDGVITSKSVQLGQWVEPAEALFHMAALDQQVIEAKVDAGDSGLITLGQQVSVSCDAFAGRTWNETVKWISPIVNAGKEDIANTFDARISLSAEAPPLLLGQQVDVKIRTAYRENVMRLPFAAVTERNGHPVVAVVKEGRAHFVPVVTGIEDFTHVEIVKGIDVGMQVILPEGKTLREGDLVSVRP